MHRAFTDKALVTKSGLFNSQTCMSYSDYHIKFEHFHGSQKNHGYEFLVTMAEKFSWTCSCLVWVPSKFLVLVHAVTDGFIIRKKPVSSHFV
jgi:hypothetical protein